MVLTGSEGASESFRVALCVHSIDGHRVIRKRGQILKQVTSDWAHLKLGQITGVHEIRGNVMGAA